MMQKLEESVRDTCGSFAQLSHAVGSMISAMKLDDGLLNLQVMLAACETVPIFSAGPRGSPGT